ncbi:MULTISPECIES: aminodeoxychorismate/anthranilate synthase component II [Vibrio]|uniref:Anthranilate synthase component II n=1 Tax=Vibrio halioticoli NBRC 102217 TaxID=1219072 RepID=V5FDW6_9VIBR|nr:MULTISPECIES: aminodeoxychorismate/anthranilate synthase component II [Vibrio]MPW37561.1 aminodeoxychorismate/anthranilate synthase component II [Vibrio sp. B1Z05]GAD88021.1 anthranilate synthase component II [Vibrio halioticoli NBRC 102217]
MLLIIDNYDSFTYNLYQYFCKLGCETKVVRNDAITLAQIHALQPQAIVISPGPCTPNEAGISLQVIQEFMGKVPLLGVCLGHQAIAQVLGGKVIRADKVMHGKTSPIRHTNQGVFTDLNNPLTVTRYHSLIVEKTSLPDCLEMTSWTVDENGQAKEIMGYRHKTLPIEGVQFHPESIKTEQGLEILANFFKHTACL